MQSMYYILLRVRKLLFKKRIDTEVYFPIPSMGAGECRHQCGALVNNYMYRYVGHVVSAIERSDSDQVLSRKGASSR